MSADPTTVARLAAVLGCDVPPVGADTVLTDVHHDSRAVMPGSLFVAVVGSRSDGHDHAAAAVKSGAVAVVVERPVDVDVPQLRVPSARGALPAAAAEVHRHPSHELAVAGVTGTNGKTTVTHMLESIVRAAGQRSGLVGTIGARIEDQPVPQARTTPESSDLQRLLRQMLDRGVEIAAVEVSSHALRLGRVEGVRFAVAAFTNLSQDHLDFHTDMEDYFAAKSALFSPEHAASAVVWIDDPWGRRLAGEVGLPLTTVGTAPEADVRVADVHATAVGSRFSLLWPDETQSIELPLPGRFNVENAAIGAVTANVLGIPRDAVARGLAELPPVPGRFEPVPVGGGLSVIVDYAHSPDAIEAVIAEAREIGSDRVVVVVGAGGDRDRDKRPPMGAAAALADRVVITSDNPRSEDPDAIIAAVLAGVGPHEDVMVEPDRRSAIHRALAAAAPGDMVLVLGKGHEQGQELADGVVEPFDDRTVVAEEWRKLAVERAG